MGGVLITGLFALSAWLMSRVSDHDTDIAAINASRFTAEDGRDVWEAIADLSAKAAVAAPPDWFRDEVKRAGDLAQQAVVELGGLKASLARIEIGNATYARVLEDHEARVRALEGNRVVAPPLPGPDPPRRGD